MDKEPSDDMKDFEITYVLVVEAENEEDAAIQAADYLAVSHSTMEPTVITPL